MLRNVLAIAVVGGFLSAGVAQAQVEFYTGASQIQNVEGDATFDNAPYTQYYPHYQEDGLDLYLEQTIWHQYNAVNIPNPPLYYPNGGYNDLIVITRVDGENLGALEMIASNGWSNATTTYVWIQAYLNGALVDEADIDLPTGGLFGVKGNFDEVHVGSYFDAATRNAHARTNLNAIAIDNVTYGDAGASAPSLAFSGNCPGTGTFEVRGLTPNGRAALAYGFGNGPTIIPNTFPCAGTQLNVGNPNFDYITLVADANGVGTFTGFIPAAACNRVKVQALDVTTCLTSNVITVQ